MFRDMRRKDKELEQKEVMEKLDTQNVGILTVLGDDEYPYGVPINYSIYNGKIIFHSAREGHKVDSMRNHEKAGFTVVISEEIVPQKFSSNFESIVVFGKIKEIVDLEEKKPRLLSLIKKYSSDFMESGEAYVNRAAEKTGVFEMEIEHITGKKSPR